MGAQTRSTTNQASPIANEFNSFLQSQLNGRSPQQNNTLNTLNGALTQIEQDRPPGWQNISNSLRNDIARQQSNQQQPQQQSNSAFQNIFNQFAGGQVNDPSGVGAYAQNFLKNGPQFTMPTYNNQYTAPQFQNVQTQQLATNFGGSGMAQYTDPVAQQAAFNTQQGIGAQGSSDYSSALNGMLAANMGNVGQAHAGSSQAGMSQAGMSQAGMSQAGMSQAALASIYGPQALSAAPQLQANQNVDMNSPEIAASQAQADMMRRRAQADMNARFGAQGAGALGTGAQYALSNLNSTFSVDAAKQAYDLINRQQQQNLAVGNSAANVDLTGRGQDLSYNLGNRNTDAGIAQSNAQNLTQSSMGNAGNLTQSSMGNASNLTQSSMGNAGNFTQSSMGNAANQTQSGISNATLGTQASIASANNAAAMRQAQMQAALGARGQDFSNQLGNRQADISQLGLGSQQAQFNAGQQNQMFQSNLAALLQNQSMGNQFTLGNNAQNSANMQSNNANAINMGQFQNQFNMNNAGNMAQFGQANNALNSNNALGAQGLNNDQIRTMLGIGMQQNQMGNNNQSQLLQSLFNGFQQSNGLGTAQAQQYQQPSPWGQLAQMGLSLGGAYFAGR